MFTDGDDVCDCWLASCQVGKCMLIRHFLFESSLSRGLFLNLPVQLVQCRACQQPPEIARAGQLILLILGMYEEAPICRLNNVLCIDSPPEFRTDPCTGQRDEPGDVAIEDSGGGFTFAGLILL